MMELNFFCHSARSNVLVQIHLWDFFSGSVGAHWGAVEQFAKYLGTNTLSKEVSSISMFNTTDFNKGWNSFYNMR